MMKQKHLAIIAIACGVVCAACVALFMMSVQGEADAARAEVLARYGGEQVEACIATRDIVAGERLDLSAVETKLWVADLLPEGALRATSDAVGKTATSSIFKGEVIVSGRFEAGHDSLDVPSGKQAVSVPAKAVQAVGGAIRPGMSVDIYSSGDTSTVALAQNVNVLDTSVGNSGSLSSGDNGWITLAVEPDRVQELIAASNKTTLYFTLPGASVESGGASLGGNTAEDAGKDAADGGADASGAPGPDQPGATDTAGAAEGARDYAKAEEPSGSSAAGDAAGASGSGGADAGNHAGASADAVNAASAGDAANASAAQKAGDSKKSNTSSGSAASNKNANKNEKNGGDR